MRSGLASMRSAIRSGSPRSAARPRSPGAASASKASTSAPRTSSRSTRSSAARSTSTPSCAASCASAAPPSCTSPRSRPGSTPTTSTTTPPPRSRRKILTQRARRKGIARVARLQSLCVLRETSVSSALRPSLVSARFQLGDFALELADQAFGAVAPQHRGELGAARRELADRARQKDVDDAPPAVVVAQQVVELDRIALGRHHAGLDQGRATGHAGLLAAHLEVLALVAVEPVGVGRDGEVLERLD